MPGLDYALEKIWEKLEASEEFKHLKSIDYKQKENIFNEIMDLFKHANFNFKDPGAQKLLINTLIVKTTPGNQLLNKLTPDMALQPENVDAFKQEISNYLIKLFILNPKLVPGKNLNKNDIKQLTDFLLKNPNFVKAFLALRKETDPAKKATMGKELLQLIAKLEKVEKVNQLSLNLKNLFGGDDPTQSADIQFPVFHQSGNLMALVFQGTQDTVNLSLMHEDHRYDPGKVDAAGKEAFALASVLTLVLSAPITAMADELAQAHPSIKPPSPFDQPK